MAKHVDIIMDNLHKFIDMKLSSLAQENPLLALIKPLAVRAINNNLYKIEFLLKQVADKDGLVDIEGIFNEMSESIINTKPFRLDTGLLGELEIGSGKIKMDIPMINKSLILNQQDLLELKNMFI